MNNPTIVELKHVGARNKGANMMLQCAIKFIEDLGPEFAPALPASSSFKFEARRGFRAYQKIGHIKYGLDWSYLTEMIPELFVRKFGVVSHRHVRVVLDCSGFAYGDQWPLKLLAHTVRHARVVRKSGGKYVLLPQAFGPFTTRKEQDLIRELIEQCDLIFPRDRASQRHLIETFGESEKIILAPDFTATLQPTPMSNVGNLGHNPAFTVVPNYKMFASGSSVDRETYFNTLLKGMRWGHQNQYDVFLLNHEGERDEAICDELAERSGIPATVFSGSITSNQAKWIISRSHLMLSSRYHACVSALSQGVTAVGTSWSHKYQELYSDYGVPELIYEFDQPIEDALSAAASDRQINSKLLTARDEQLAKVAEMWRAVEASLGSLKNAG